jgi:hypothetical protein
LTERSDANHKRSGRRERSTRTFTLGHEGLL